MYKNSAERHRGERNWYDWPSFRQYARYDYVMKPRNPSFLFNLASKQRCRYTRSEEQWKEIEAGGYLDYEDQQKMKAKLIPFVTF